MPANISQPISWPKKYTADVGHERFEAPTAQIQSPQIQHEKWSLALVGDQSAGFFVGASGKGRNPGTLTMDV